LHPFLKELHATISKNGGPDASRAFEEFYCQLAHPAESKKLLEYAKLADSDRTRLAFGGGDTITRLGMEGRVSLGRNFVGNPAQFMIQGQATVQFEMWMLLASAPCGAWVYGGPGTWSVTLGGNILSCAPETGSPCSIYAYAQSGTVPVWVTAN
jgi:hypothetical protein